MKLGEVRTLAMALPEVTEEPHFQYTSWRVKGKIFATAPPEGDVVHIFLDEHETRAAADEAPAVCELLPWGKKIAGLRVKLKAAKPADVGEWLAAAWRRKAPKKLAR